MRRNSCELKSAASSPPTPARISRMTLAEGRRDRSRGTVRRVGGASPFTTVRRRSVSLRNSAAISGSVSDFAGRLGVVEFATATFDLRMEFDRRRERRPFAHQRRDQLRTDRTLGDDATVDFVEAGRRLSETGAQLLDDLDRHGEKGARAPLASGLRLGLRGSVRVTLHEAFDAAWPVSTSFCLPE
jgi:hypothetical protein